MAGRKPDSPAVAEHKRRLILDAALRVFAEKGYGESTVPEIAAEAGVAVGTIYNYFTAKRDLLIALMMERFFTEPFVELLESGGLGGADFLSAFLENRIRFGRENIDSFIFLLNEVQRNSEVRELWVERVIHRVLGRIRTFLEEGVADGRFRSVELEIASRAIAGMAIGFMILHSMEREKSPVASSDPAELASILAGLVRNGIRKGEG